MNDFTFTREAFEDQLKYRSGFSRRIDDANRLVYDFDELNNIRIISCKGHYEE